MSTQTDQQPKDATPSTQDDQQNNVASFRRVLKNRNFLLLWVAQLTSLTVLNAVNFGVVLLVTELTHSVFMVGLAYHSYRPFAVLLRYSALGCGDYHAADWRTGRYLCAAGVA